MNPRVMLYGRDQPLPERVPLSAGPLRMVFEGGDLRYIRLGDLEVWRRVYVAVRDRNWNTIPASISNLDVVAGDGWFRVRYDAEHVSGDIDFYWHASFEGDRDGRITCEMDGVARSTFLRNRIGFCLLHPIRECAGRRVEVEHADGSLEEGVFPRVISPHQPFMDIRGLAHELPSGGWARARFEGDVFEMEDQRNWTDASFKTYSTPLALPFPVEVPAGTRIRQRVTLWLEDGEVSRQYIVREAGRVELSLSRASGQVPELGLCVPSDVRAHSPREVDRLRAMGPTHLRAELWIRGRWRDELARALSLAGALGCRLELAVFAPEEAGWAPALLDAVGPHAAQVSRVLLFHEADRLTRAEQLEHLRAELSRRGLRLQVGGGTDAYFAQLNRSRPEPSKLDCVCYSANPQVHAEDNSSLVENLEGQLYPVVSAREVFGERPVYVTPLTLRPRFNPAATAPEPPASEGELPSQVDPRQMSLFGAAWTLGALTYLALGGASGVTCYETVGWLGVMEGAQGSPLPEAFGSVPGGVFPLYHVLADWCEFVGGEWRALESSDPLSAVGIMFRRGGRATLLVANLLPTANRIVISGEDLELRLRVLDQANYMRAVTDPEGYRESEWRRVAKWDGRFELELGPYAVARMDVAS